MERTFLLELEQQLTRMEVSARAELIQNQRRENMLKIWSSMKSSSVTKYSPDHYHLVKVNNGLSLTIMTLTHMEEEVQQVDFEVDLAKPPNPVLVQFLSSNLCREVIAGIRKYCRNRNLSPDAILSRDRGGAIAFDKYRNQPGVD